MGEGARERESSVFSVCEGAAVAEVFVFGAVVHDAEPTVDASSGFVKGGTAHFGW